MYEQSFIIFSLFHDKSICIYISQWVPRSSMKEIKPRTIREVRDEAAKDHGMWNPPRSLHGGRREPSLADMNFFGSPMMNGSNGREPVGMNDMFRGMSKGFMGKKGFEYQIH